MTEKLTFGELWDLVELCDTAADDYDNTEYDEALYEKYTALREKLYRMVREMKEAGNADQN
jgi:hypothetical protein